ncbi:hypothetical protein C8R47DRAFT_1083230 [Mycena vitilis]|nr:hypothetical protein C8R47DRAFT_1083230 [Mycena vitilis]
MSSLSLSRSSGEPTSTNLKAHEMVLDRRGQRDERYWCLPQYGGGEQGQQEGAKKTPPRPRPITKQRLVRPEEDGNAQGPLLKDVERPAPALPPPPPALPPLVRPEEDGSAHGPLLENIVRPGTALPPPPPALPPLARPEEDGSAHGPLLENVVRPGTALPPPLPALPPLARPEEDGSAHGPLLEHVVRPGTALPPPPPPPALPPLVRPEEDGSAHGPLLENVVRPGTALPPPPPPPALPPLVRPEEDGSAHGPLLEHVVRAGEEDGESNGAVLWPDEDREKWYPDLVGAVAAFASLGAWGGDEWVECVGRLIISERAWGFRPTGLLGATKSHQGRPTEVSKFMTYARKWEVELDTATIGPRSLEGSFAHGWRNGEGRLCAAEDVDMAEWEVLAKTHGRNGLLLVVACLYWWGTAAADNGDAGLREDWGMAVREVSAMLGQAVKGVGAMIKSLGDAVKASKKAAAARKKKAAEEDTAAAAEDEGKRGRTRGAKRSLEKEKENEKEVGRKRSRKD